ncbi:uncharacterized protein FIBRA_01800 [Fibroporia radiculosa]|uniref:Uncharacterized protein n=1 Tax=Fibroporia radiculosa TaxID=599839 RepID=J4G168_9APHY|nr:uncharacterized protein FIBRA_01800 [Fibroporia radiculosa]CCL99778.1 predicted protein [Fibroporia radiculosa]
MTREGEQSPGRLTIAQANLLNMQGGRLSPRSPVSPLLSPDFDCAHPTFQGAPSLLSTNGFAGVHLNKRGLPLSPMSHNASAVSYGQQSYHSPLHDLQEMSMPGEEQAYDTFRMNAPKFMGQDLRLSQQTHYDDMFYLQEQLQLAKGMGMVGAAARAENGYTAMERLLLQGYLQRQQTQQLFEAEVQEAQFRHSLLSQARGLNHSATLPADLSSFGTGSAGREPSRRLPDVLPPMSENDFHATAASHQRSQRPMYLDTDLRHESSVPGTFSGSRNILPTESSSRLDINQQFSLAQQRQRNQTHSTYARAEAEAHAQALHTRSTTFPSQYLSGRDSAYDVSTDSNQQNNGRPYTGTFGDSMDTTRPIKSAVLGNVGLGSNGINSTNAGGRDNSSFKASSYIRSNMSGSRDRSGLTGMDMSSVFSNIHGAYEAVGSRLSNKSSGIGSAHPHHGEEEEASSPLMSPALTYSARTPASLSPATPASGFSFEVPSIHGVTDGRVVGAEKQKMRTMN